MNLDPSSWPSVTWLAAAIALAVGLGVGILVTRRSKGVARVRELERELEESRTEFSAYREQVSGHFTETGKHLRDLALQYRTVYEHLSEGARTLCPDASVTLESGLGVAALAEHSEDALNADAKSEETPLVEALSEESALAGSDTPFQRKDEVQSDTVS